MNVLSFNFVPSLVSAVNEKATTFLTSQQKRVAIIALAALSMLALAVYFFRNSCFKGNAKAVEPSVINDFKAHLGNVFKGNAKAVEAPDLKLAQSKLEEGINISDDTLSKLKDLMPKIQKLEKDDAIEWLSTNNNLVFKIAGSSDLIFKMARGGEGSETFQNGKWIKNSELMDERFATMIKGKAVCLTHQLELLIIPHAKKIEIDGHTLIAQEQLDIAASGFQEELYNKYSGELNEAVRQLAIFIAKTGFNSVQWHNIPLINESDDFHGNRRVGLVGIGRMEGAAEGCCGLIRCVSEKQIDLVIAEARKQGVAITDEQIERAKNLRLQELEFDKKLETFYEKNHIVNGKEPIQVDVDSLGLDLSEEAEMEVVVGVEDDDLKWGERTVTLRKVTEDVIEEINKCIRAGTDEASIKKKRNFLLSTSKDPMRNYHSLGLPQETLFVSEEQEKKLWIQRIIQALIDKGHLVELRKNGHGYSIQA